MMRKDATTAFLLAGALASVPMASSNAAPPYELVRQDRSCPVGTETRSLRQTIIIVDEAIIGETLQSNQIWTRMVVDAADAREASTGMLGARERVSLLVARRDGSELVPLFSGCAPNVSKPEQEKLRSKDTDIDRFLGRDSEARAAAVRTDFGDSLARALAQIRKRGPELAALPAPAGALVRALHNGGRLADLNQGLPRFVLVTPFKISDADRPVDIATARARGFAAAKTSGLDFGRAEIYVVGATFPDSPSLEFARAMFLGAKGYLAGVRSDGLPPMLGEPTISSAFAGFMSFGDQRISLQLRLSATAQGDLVNAWLESTVNSPAATPLTGKMFCRSDVCDMHGDGSFAQVWFTDPAKEPPDRSILPFAGARNVDIQVKHDIATGRVFDPKVIFAIVNERRPELRFDIARREDNQF